MVVFVSSFLAGILFILQLEQLPHWWFWCGLPAAIFFMFFRPYRWLGFMLAGFYLSWWQVNNIKNPTLPPQLEGETLTVTGHIHSLVHRTDARQRFLFKTEQLVDETGRHIWSKPGIVRLSWYQRQIPVHPGERWQLTVRLKRPRGFSNPSGFDYEAWLFREHIQATGYILNQPKRRLPEKEFYPLQRLRSYLTKKIDTLALQHVGLIKALAIGDRSDVTKDDWQILRNTGTNHLIAISGLHIGLIAGIAFFITRYLWGKNRWGNRLLSTYHFAHFIALFAALIYAALAGFSIPTQRALIMLFSFYLTRLGLFQITSLNTILLAFFIILIFDPFALLATDFWLSFLAIFFIFYVVSYRSNKKSSRIWRWGIIQIAITIGLAPLLIYYFQQLPVLSIVANFIAVPWVGVVIVPLVLIGIFCTLLSIPGAVSIFTIADSMLAYLWSYLIQLSNTPFNVFYTSAPSWALIPAFFGAAILLMPRGLPARWLGLCWLLPLIATPISRPQNGDMKVALLDVGQGLSLVIMTKRHNLLYDTGAAFTPEFDAGSAVVAPYLRQQHISSLDTVIISHADNDHIGGLTTIAKAFPIKRLLSSTPKKTKYKAAEYCLSGQKWQWDGVDFEILHPASISKFRGNNASCVLKANARGMQILISGDIEKKAEKALLQQPPLKLSADILVVPHHGSLTSSHLPFINTVKPDYALISAGYKNRFRLPAITVVKRYQNAAAEVLNTAKTGAIIIASHEDGYTIKTTRVKNHLWSHEK